MKTIIPFIYHFSLLVSALMALVHHKALRSRLLSILIPFLLYLFIQEMGIYVYLRKCPSGSTGIIYNVVYNPLSAIVFVFLYSRIPFNKKAGRLLLFLLLIYLLTTVITLAFLQPLTTLNFNLSLMSGFVITCSGITFLFTYFNIDNTSEEKHWRPLLWITIGIVIFYPVVNISWAFHKYLLKYDATIGGIKIYQLIPQVMSIFMYSCFAYAFYLCKRKN